MNNQLRLIIWLVVCSAVSAYYYNEYLKSIKQVEKLAVSTEEQIGFYDEHGEYDESGVQTENTPQVVAKGKVGEKAMDFVFTDMENPRKKVDLAKLKQNKIVILLFWDPWDFFSINQMKVLNVIHDQRERDKENKKQKIRFSDTETIGFASLVAPENSQAINLDTFMLQAGIHFTHVLATDEQEERALLSIETYYNLVNTLLPLTVIIDKEGTIRYRNSGFINFDAIVEQIEDLREKEDN